MAGRHSGNHQGFSVGEQRGHPWCSLGSTEEQAEGHPLGRRWGRSWRTLSQGEPRTQGHSMTRFMQRGRGERLEALKLESRR